MLVHPFLPSSTFVSHLSKRLSSRRAIRRRIEIVLRATVAGQLIGRACFRGVLVLALVAVFAYAVAGTGGGTKNAVRFLKCPATCEASRAE